MCAGCMPKGAEGSGCVGKGADWASTGCGPITVVGLGSQGGILSRKSSLESSEVTSEEARGAWVKGRCWERRGHI